MKIIHFLSEPGKSIDNRKCLYAFKFPLTNSKKENKNDDFCLFNDFKFNFAYSLRCNNLMLGRIL